MKRRDFLLGSTAALLPMRQAEAAFNIFNASKSVLMTYTASGPSTGTTGSPSTNFTVVIGSGVFSGSQTITISDGGAGGTFTSSVGSGTSSATMTPLVGTISFTFTYNAVSNGLKTLTFTNGQGWIDPPVPLTYTASGGGGAGQIAAIAFGSASFTQQNSGTPGFAETNTTAGPLNGLAGWQAGQVWCIRQTYFNFPSDDIYQFVIPCSVDATGGAVFVNSVMLYIDQVPIQTSIGNTTNNNWFTQFCRNTAPSQNFTFSGPVKAGFHSIRIDLNSAAYEAFPVVSGGNNHSGENHLMHCDGIIISTTGAGLPAEPSPQDRDPSVFPHSAWHFINTPFGSLTQFDLPSTPRSQSINGTGGNGANLQIKSTSFSVNSWTAGAAAPVFSISSTDFAQSINPPWPVRCQAGIIPSFGSDAAILLIDKTQPRYMYGGGNVFSVNGDGRSGGNATMNVTDSYNQNHPIPQVMLGNFGLLTLDDLQSGAIKHRLCGGLGFAATVGGTTGYAPATQTSSKSGMPWPGCMSDYNWPGVYTNPNGVPYGSVIGIPPGVTKPGGLTTGGNMIWDCFQHYGLHLNVTGSTYPTVFFQADGLASSSPLLAQINAALSTITPNLCVMSNPQPIVNSQGFGGGTPVVPLLHGVIQGYASIGAPPYTFPGSPVGIPIQCATNGDGGGLGSGQAQGSAVVSPSIPTGSFVMAMLTMDRPNAVPFTNPVNDSAGNSYTVFQPTASSSCIQRALAICASTTAPIGNGTNWQPTFTPGSTLWVFLGAYRRPKPPSGSTTLRVANSAFSAASVTTLSTTLAGVQANDLVIGLVGVNNGQDYYFTDPSGFSPLCNFPFLAPTGGISLSSQIAPSSGTFTYNPSWPNASPAQVIAVAFANANIAT